MERQLPAIGEKLWDPGAHGQVVVTEEGQREFFQMDMLVKIGMLGTAFALAQIQEKRLYRHVGYENMDQYITEGVKISRRQGHLYIGIGKKFQEHELLGADGKPTPMGLLGITKLELLIAGFSPEELKQLTEDGEYMGPDGEFHTIEELTAKTVPELKQEMKKLRRRERDLEEGLTTAKAEVRQLQEERAEGKTAENLVKEMDDLRTENVMLKGERDKGEKAWAQLKAAEDQIDDGVKVLERWRLFTVRDYNDDPVTYQKIAAACARFAGRLAGLENRIAQVAHEAAEEE